MIQAKLKSVIKKTVTDNMQFRASEEAKICLTCPIKVCKPDSCKRFKEEKRKLKERNREKQ